MDFAVLEWTIMLTPLLRAVRAGVNEPEAASKNHLLQRRCSHLEDGVAAVTQETGAGLDQPLAQRGQ